MVTKAKDSSAAMLEWQYRTILAELQQIELHESGDCPCILSDLKPPEKCLGKHTLNVFSLCNETAAMDSVNAKMLREIAEKASEYHDKYKDFICHTGDLPDLREWSRSSRKLIEPVYYTCSVKKPRAQLRDAAPAIAELMAPRHRSSRLVSPEQISDFRIGTDRYVRRDDKCFIVDGEGMYADTEVACDFLTDEIRSNIANLQGREATMMIQAVRSTPFLTEEGRRERLMLLSKHRPMFTVIETIEPLQAKLFDGIGANYRSPCIPVIIPKAEAAELFDPAPVKIAGKCDANICKFRVTATEITAGTTGSLRGLAPLIREVSARADAHRQPKVVAAESKEITTDKTFALGITTATRYEFEWEIIDGHDLIVSNDPFTFEPNPKYTKALQPRDRGRAATKLQVETIASKLAPDLLLLDYLSLDKGSPIIGPDKIVECGNGRVMGIVRAAQTNPDKFAAYRARLKELAPQYGLKASTVDKMDVPILVRVRLTDVDRQAFAQECNARTGIQSSAIENAKTDAEKITPEMLSGLDVLEGESIENAIRSQRNKPFVTAFLNKLPANEQAGLVDSKGVLSQDGVRRIVVAIFLATFHGDVGMTLGEKFFEANEPDVKNVFAGILRALGPLSRAETLVAGGMRESDYAFGEDLARAVAVYSRIKNTADYTVAKYLAQMALEERELNPFQERVLQVLDQNARSAKRIGVILSNYGQAVVDSPPPGQASFMISEKLSKAQLFESAVRKAMDALLEDIARLFAPMTRRQREEALKFQLPMALDATEIIQGEKACPTCKVITPPKKYELFPFQKEGVEWLRGRKFALLADEMGLGKTPQAIHWAADNRPVLVVVPSALLFNWEREITKMWRPSDTAVVLDSAQSLPATLPDWVICSYGSLGRWVPKFRKAGFQSIVIDEAHLVKNLEAQRTQNLLELVQPEEPEPDDKPIPYRLAVTGTPILNRPIELFALMVFLGVKSKSKYRDFLRTYQETKEYKGRTLFTGSKNLDSLFGEIKDFMLRRKKMDVLKQLPPKISTAMFVAISNASEYKEAERNFLAWLRENAGSEAAARAARAEEIAQMNALRRLAADGKVDAVADWLKPCDEEAGQGKVLVFSSFVEPLQELARRKGGDVYTGATPPQERQDIVDRFQSGMENCFFYGTIGAAGVGITLTKANRVVFLDLPWTPGAKIQAEDRAHRIGQTKTVEVVNVLARGTIDERLLELLSDKEFIIAQAVDGKTKTQALSSNLAGDLIMNFRRNPSLSDSVMQYESDVDDEPVKKKTAELSDYTAEKLRAAADALQKQIDAKRDPAISHQNVTARRSRIASSMADEADRIEKRQKALRGMADALEAGTLPAVLRKFTPATVDQVLTYQRYHEPYVHRSNIRDLRNALIGSQLKEREEIQLLLEELSTRAGPEDYVLPIRSDREIELLEKVIKVEHPMEYHGQWSRPTYIGHWVSDAINEGKRLWKAGIHSEAEYQEAKKALLEYVTPPSADILAKRRERELVASLVGQKIPGFFPTPRSLVEKMVEVATLSPGMTVLEPSAGKGDIADIIRERCPDCALTLVEQNWTLIEILRQKGYSPVQGDFLEYDPAGHEVFDRVVMNPPFEHGQDVDHVLHAYALLKPGGRVVAIMSTHSSFANDSKSQTFRTFLAAMRGESQDLPSGTFTGEEAFVQTGVASKLVWIDKPIEAKPEAEGSPKLFYGDWVITPDGRIGQMHGSGGLGSNRVTVRAKDGTSLGYFDRAELTLTKEPVEEQSVGALVQRAFGQMRLFDYSWLATKIDKCNLSVRDVDAALNWRPLRLMIEAAVGAKAKVGMCSIGLIYGILQVTMSNVREKAIPAIERLSKVKGIKRVYTKTPRELIFEVSVPKGATAEVLTWEHQEVKTEPARREPAEQAALFERTPKSVVAAVEKSIQEENDAVKAYTVRMRKAKDAGDTATVKVYKHIIPQEAEHSVELGKRLDQLEGSSG